MAEGVTGEARALLPRFQIRTSADVGVAGRPRGDAGCTRAVWLPAADRRFLVFVGRFDLFREPTFQVFDPRPVRPITD